MHVGFTDQTANWRVRSEEAVFRVHTKVHKRKYYILYFPVVKIVWGLTGCQCVVQYCICHLFPFTSGVVFLHLQSEKNVSILQCKSTFSIKNDKPRNSIEIRFQNILGCVIITNIPAAYMFRPGLVIAGNIRTQAWCRWYHSTVIQSVLHEICQTPGCCDMSYFEWNMLYQKLPEYVWLQYCERLDV